MADKFNVDVIYAGEQTSYIKPVEVTPDDSIKAIILRSGILDDCPEIDLTQTTVGVFSERRSLEDTLEPGDRIEIYRPLKIDPKQARRGRARKKTSNSTD